MTCSTPQYTIVGLHYYLRWLMFKVSSSAARPHTPPPLPTDSPRQQTTSRQPARLVQPNALPQWLADDLQQFTQTGNASELPSVVHFGHEINSNQPPAAGRTGVQPAAPPRYIGDDLQQPIPHAAEQPIVQPSAPPWPTKPSDEPPPSYQSLSTPPAPASNQQHITYIIVQQPPQPRASNSSANRSNTTSYSPQRTLTSSSQPTPQSSYLHTLCTLGSPAERCLLCATILFLLLMIPPLVLMVHYASDSSTSLGDQPSGFIYSFESFLIVTSGALLSFTLFAICCCRGNYCSSRRNNTSSPSSNLSANNSETPNALTALLQRIRRGLGGQTSNQETATHTRHFTMPPTERTRLLSNNNA